MSDFDFGADRPDASGTGSASDGSDPSSGSGGGMPDMSSSGGREPPGDFDISGIPENFDPSERFGEGGQNGGASGMGGMSSSDVKLQYIDDELDSYSNIWNNAKTDITEADQNRLIQSLKNAVKRRGCCVRR